MMKNSYINDCYVQLIFSHTESYGVISLHELKGNEVLHVFELAWISVPCCALPSVSNSKTSLGMKKHIDIPLLYST